MKKFRNIILSGLLFLGLNQSCKKDFIEGYDVDPNRPLDVSMDVLLTSSEAYTIYVTSSDLPRITNVIMQQMTGADRQFLAIDRYVIAGSDFILNHIHSNYDIKAKSTVVKRGIDEKYFSKTNVSDQEIKKLKDSMNIDDKKFIILFPGRLTYWKGQKLFIESLNILNQKKLLENVYAFIIGGHQGRINYKEELIQMIKNYKLGDKLMIAHSLSKIPVAYSIANLVVSCSTEPESFGRISVEAQSMEKPVLASDIGGSLETVINNKTGWLFKNNDIHDLSEKIKMIIKTEQNVLNLIGRQGRKNVKENYTRELMVSRTLEIYRSLV